MENGQMIEKVVPYSNGFTEAVISNGWRICFVTKDILYGELSLLKKHNDTDEAFILLRRTAKLYTITDTESNRIDEIDMSPCMIYNIQAGTWHHLQIFGDSLLMAVENNHVSAENTERMIIC